MAEEATGQDEGGCTVARELTQEEEESSQKDSEGAEVGQVADQRELGPVDQKAVRGHRDGEGDAGPAEGPEVRQQVLGRGSGAIFGEVSDSHMEQRCLGGGGGGVARGGGRCGRQSHEVFNQLPSHQPDLLLEPPTADWVLLLRTATTAYCLVL